MRPRTRLLLAVQTVAFGAIALSSVNAQGQPTNPNPFGSFERKFTGFGLYIEEDFLYAARNQDRNYTGGLGLQAGGDWVNRAYLAKPLDGVDRLTGVGRKHDARTRRFTNFMFTGTAFTPDSLNTKDPVFDDRPYASLLALTTAHQSVDDNGKSIWTSQLSIGVLGLSLLGDVQASIHRGSRSRCRCDRPYHPQGWLNQISDGGEPTALYKVAYEQLLWESAELGNRWFQASGGWELNGGYYTNVAGSLLGRIGLINSEFWEFNHNPMNSVNQRVGESRGSPIEAFVFGASRPRLVAYNALLQGQFRESVHTLSGSDIRRALVEYETGIAVSARFGENRFGLTWVYVAGRTAEFKGPMERTHTWGSAYLTMARPFIPRP